MRNWIKQWRQKRRENSFYRSESRRMEPYWAREQRVKTYVIGAAAVSLWVLAFVGFFTYHPMGPITSVYTVESAWIQSDTSLVFAICEQASGQCDVITVYPKPHIMQQAQLVERLLQPGQFAIFAEWGDNAIDKNGGNPGMMISECYAGCSISGRPPLTREVYKFDQSEYHL